MDGKLTRRQFGKMAAAGAALGVMAGTGSTVQASVVKGTAAGQARRWLPNGKELLGKWREIIHTAVAANQGAKEHRSSASSAN